MFPLILESARTKPEGAAVRRLAAQVRDWDEVVRTATSLGVAPLLFSTLSRLGADLTTAQTLHDLKTRFHAGIRSNLVLTTELLRVLGLFRGAGIEAIPYKGPTLAAQLYDPPALRESADLDVLIDKADVPRAVELFLSSGYRSRYPKASLRVFNAISEIPLHGRPGVLELHWRVGPLYFNAFQPAYLHKRLTSLRIEGCDVPVLSAEDLLPILCVHGAKHFWGSLKWLCDIARLVELPGLDWDSVIVRSEEMRVMRTLLLGIELSRGLLSATVPPEVAKRIGQDDCVRALVSSTRDILLGGQRAGERDRMLYQFRLLTDWRDQSMFWASKLLVPTTGEWESWPIPASLFPLYYLFRPLRLAWRLGAGRIRPS
jgi:hypothetical protein